MHQIEQPQSHRSPSLVAALITVALLVVFGQPGTAMAQWATSGNDISNTNTGNVGIGTSSPGTKLEVQGPDVALTLSSTGAQGKTVVQAISMALSLSANALYSSSWTRHNTGFPAWNMYFEPSPAVDEFAIRRASAGANPISWSTLFKVTGNGSVGIGTASPAVFFHAKSPANTHGNIYLDTTTAGYGAAFSFLEAGVPKASIQHNPSVIAGGLVFQTGGHAAPAFTRMVITSTGDVGIGTTTPQARLDVNGSINVSGNINAKYQDVAEWVEAARQFPAGTVVVLNPAKSNQVLASTRAYDTSVAGVVSAQPGLILGEGGDGKVMVATTGRVKVKVDARRASIHIGDLLVTSNEEGVAMKSEPLNLGGAQLHRPGTLIGKALESLETGTGEILVLLSLQ